MIILGANQVPQGDGALVKIVLYGQRKVLCKVTIHLFCLAGNGALG